MNTTIYTDKEKNAIRFSNFRKLESTCPFSGFGIKYVASGEEIYYANDKKYKVNAGEYIIGNEFTKSIVQIDHAEMVQGDIVKEQYINHGKTDYKIHIYAVGRV